MYTYDDLGRKETETVQYPGFSKTFSYTYDAVSLKRSFSMPGGPAYSFTYDAANQLKTIRIPSIGTISYPSYTMGRPDSVSFPGGSTQTYQYDALMRIERITAPNMDYQYTSYDNVGNILTKQTEHGNYVYDYDDVSRLLTADNPAVDDDAFTYDGVGNRETASNVTSGTISHNENNELTLYGDITYEYDANGNMTRKSLGTAAILYTYDVADRLVMVEDEAAGTTVADYYYDPFGRRLWKDVGGTRTYFLYADEGLVAEYDASGNEIRSYGYQPDSTWTTDPLWLKEGGTYYWYQNDHLGTPQKLVDNSGAVVWSAEYTAFGEALIQVETVTNNLRFPGQYVDEETGLHYNRFRYYDPRIGRYLRTDPIGFGGGDVNWYAYAWNNSMNVTDSFGLQVGLTPLHVVAVKFDEWLDRVMPSQLRRERCPLGERPTGVLAVGPLDGLQARLAKNEAEALVHSLDELYMRQFSTEQKKAFRHCYVNCIMTQRIGAEDAKQAADTHEWCGHNPVCMTLADTYNNEVGRMLGEKKEMGVVAVPHVQILVELPVPINCETACMDALLSGMLTVDFPEDASCDPGEDPWETVRPFWCAP